MRHLTRRPTTLTVAAATAVFFLAGCGGDDAGEDAAPADPPETTEAPAEEDTPAEDEPAADEGATVTIEDADGFAFTPADVEIDVGETVTWTHEGSIAHTVTADDSAFDSGTLTAGDTFTFTADEVGEYPYVCDFHGNMTGTITVS